MEYLDSEYESGDAGEAPVLEQEGGGVKLMTVHKAKGLEFPVVILADLTAKLSGQQGGDRYSDPEQKLCAQRLLWCAPWELLDAAEAEAAADLEEALRVAYVAATRARDLLVVATVGEEEREGGWLMPLHDALYPEKDRWRVSETAPGCPKFGHTTVFNRPQDDHEERSVKPGLHRPKIGEHQVVWFDPGVLGLRAEKAEGVENEQVLGGTTEQGVEGLRRYREWEASRAGRLESGSGAAAPGGGGGRRCTRRRKPRIFRWRRLRCLRRRGAPRGGGSGAWSTTFCSMPQDRTRRRRWPRSGGGGTARQLTKRTPPRRRRAGRWSSWRDRFRLRPSAFANCR